MRSSTGSQLIMAFTQTKHNMQLNKDKERMTELKSFMKSRAQQAQSLVKVVEEQSIEKSVQLAEKFKTMTDHKVSLEQFAVLYKTDLTNGLTMEEAERRYLEQGPNRLSEKEGTHWSLKLLAELTSPFAMLLWIGAILAFIAYALSSSDPSNLYLGVVICVINLLTGLLTFYQSMKSEAIMDSFKNFTPQQALVVRDGEPRKIDASKLVTGDVVKVQLGDKIPADLRIIHSQGMKVDNSSLTGEPDLLLRTNKCTDDNPLESKNIAFFSTLNRQGKGVGVVFATGDNTFIGQIANLAANARSEEAPLKQEIKRFIIYLTIFAVTIGVILFGLGFAVGYPAVLNFIFAIGIITANVPEGLIVEVTVGLTLTAKRLSERKVLCKNLDAVETLGSTSCICSDKTGTLTTNRMTATNIWYSDKIRKAHNKQKEKDNVRYEYDEEEPGFKAFQQVAVVCSDADFDKSLPSDKKRVITSNEFLSEEEKNKRLAQLEKDWNEQLGKMLYLDMPTTGDASQTGLIKFFQPLGDIRTMRAKYPVVEDFEGKPCKFPFNSEFKYAFCINRVQTPTSHYCIFIKGAPERIWERCTFMDIDGSLVPKTPELTRNFENANKTFAKNGERVLGFAKYHLPKDKYPLDYKFDLQKLNFQMNQQCFVGVLSLTDPPRDSVPFAVLKCRAAGVKVIMVTGDQPITAAAIAKKCNIINQETVNEIAERKKITFDEAFHQSEAIVITGGDLTKMAQEDEGLPQSEKGKKLQRWLSKSQIVFARTSPPQKLVIVNGCQKIGEVVAVTGDGVNDSPAIKKADIGISMGITGTQVAKDAADMILLNDDFSSIVVGIEEGRRIFDNLKKSICYALTSQISQMLPFVGFVIIQFPLPATTVTVLYISIGTDLIPAISFAYQVGQLDIMTRRPRHREQHMVSLTMMSQAYGYIGWTQFWGSIFAYYIVANDFGFKPGDLQFKANAKLIKPLETDTYNPTSQTLGNSALNPYKTSCPPDSLSQLTDWIYTSHAWVDLRMSALSCNVVNGVAQYTQIFDWGSCNLQQISPFSNRPVCFTPEGIKYAQSAYFYATVLGQIFNMFCCKSRKLSFITQGMNNSFMVFSLITEVMLMLAVAFVTPLNVAFGMRDNAFMHFGWAALPVAMLQLAVDQLRKYMIRTLQPDVSGKPHWFVRAALW